MTEEKLALAIKMMMQTDRMHKNLFDKMLADIGIHRTSHIILFNIAKSEVMPSQKSLSDMLGITPAAVTCALKKMERDGYISRKTGSDNRYNEVYLTDCGRNLLDKTRKKFREIDRTLFEGFTELELNNYIDCLSKMQNNLKEIQ